ncbi:MAG: hypothetical protein IJS94_06725 [Clostridia bacterium]|nr:hypothetical protein [Clostridia bacterium]
MQQAVPSQFAPTIPQTQDNSSKNKGKKIAILVSALTVSIILAVVGVIVGVRVYNLNQYEKLLNETYSEICDNASSAEAYATLQSKVWRNCIYNEDSTETDKYTKNGKGIFYEDFNDALRAFYDGESFTLSSVSTFDLSIKVSMNKLKDYPSKYEEEYKSLKKLYTAYSNLADLVIGDSSYSWTTFSEALERAKADFKTARADAETVLG